MDEWRSFFAILTGTHDFGLQNENVIILVVEQQCGEKQPDVGGLNQHVRLRGYSFVSFHDHRNWDNSKVGDENKSNEFPDPIVRPPMKGDR